MTSFLRDTILQRFGAQVLIWNFDIQVLVSLKYQIQRLQSARFTVLFQFIHIKNVQ